MTWVIFTIAHSYTWKLLIHSFFLLVWRNLPLVNITNLKGYLKVNEGKINVPGGLNLYLNAWLIFKKGHRINRKYTLLVSSNGVYLYRICIFIFFICYLWLFFFILRTKVNLKASFTLKEHKLTEKTQPHFQHSFKNQALIQSFVFLWFLDW